MTTLTLTKHHGLGNDFLVLLLDEAEAAPADPASLAQQLCDRRRGIGADGLLIGFVPPGHEARMVLHNADGSRAEMSGNGIRCFAQALAQRAGSLAPQRILTDAGERRIELAEGDHPATVMATVEMGRVGELAEPEGWSGLGAHPDRPVAHLDLGNPHSVVGVDEVGVVDLAVLGAKVPQVNLEIVEPGPEPHAVTMRVHERGVGITEACGTGACAAAWAAVRWGLVAASGRQVLVHMDGGDATVTVDAPTVGSVTLTGPATYVGRLLIPADTLWS